MLLLVNGVPRAVCAALAFAHERTGAYHGGCQRLPNFFARPKGLRCRAMALQHSSSGTAKHGMPHSRRHDIDGLRALAVLFVIAFHYAPTAVPGGFIGVSVFFAISGFLMGQILDTTHDVDLAVFYRRRAVRIVPATLVCITLSLLALFAIRVPPASLFDALEATAASLLSAANISYWWRASGYFAASDDSRRLLLHLWSLGVEEQFYLFLPLLMRFCASSFRVPVVGALLALTAVASYIVTQSHANAAYYLLVFRAPELLVGVLASMALSRGYRIATIIKRHHCMLHWASVAALVTVAMLFGEAMPFPSVTAMLPATLTAVALLAGAADDDNTIDDGDDRRVNVAKLLLSEPLLRWIGLVSFSLYLYHRPLLVIVRLLEWPQTNWLLCKLFCATLCLAYVSYRFVEEPARTKCASLSLRFLVLTRLALLIVVVALLSSYTVWTPYYTVRRQPQSNITTQNTTMMTAMSSDCQMDLGYLPDLKGFSVFCCPFFQFSKALLYFRLPFPLFFFAMCIPISLYASGQLPYVTSGDNMIIVADARMNTPPYSIPQSLRGYARLPSRVLLWGDSHAIHAVMIQLITLDYLLHSESAIISTLFIQFSTLSKRFTALHFLTFFILGGSNGGGVGRCRIVLHGGHVELRCHRCAEYVVISGRHGRVARQRVSGV